MIAAIDNFPQEIELTVKSAGGIRAANMAPHLRKTNEDVVVATSNENILYVLLITDLGEEPDGAKNGVKNGLSIRKPVQVRETERVRSGRGVAAVSPGGTRPLFIYSKNGIVKILIDCGAEVSIWPVEKKRSQERDGF